MKHLELLENFNSDKQIIDSDSARESLSKIYTIEDEVSLSFDGKFKDFLVDSEQYIKYAKKYDGNFAANEFDIDDAIIMMEYISFHITPVLYVAPFWFTRFISDIEDFRDVYSDSLYIPVNDLTRSKSLLYELERKFNPDEIDKIESDSGKEYIRMWWD